MPAILLGDVFAVAIDQRAVTLEPDSFRTALSAVHCGALKLVPNRPSPSAGRLEHKKAVHASAEANLRTAWH